MKTQLLLLTVFLLISITLKSQCDASTITIDTTLAICNGDISTPGGYDQTGTYIDTILVNGQCTIRTINLAVAPPFPDQVLNITICEGDPVPPIETNPRDTIVIFEGNILQCTYNEITNVTVFPTTTSVTSYDICENDTLIFNGQILTESGEYITTSTNANGCDSTAIYSQSL